MQYLTFLTSGAQTTEAPENQPAASPSTHCEGEERYVSICYRKYKSKFIRQHFSRYT